jgi:antitoxin VapB
VVWCPSGGGGEWLDNSQAVRLPKEIAYGDDVELIIVRSGDVVTIYPAAYSLKDMVSRLEALPRPPTIEQRDVEELPERRGL